MPELKQTIRSFALAQGFDTVRFTKSTLPPQIAERLHTYLREGRHGEMTWMESRTKERSNPKALWPQANSAIVLGMNYGPEENPIARLNETQIGNISVYGLNKDYHDVIKKKLKAIGRWLAADTETELKVFVDTAPVMEKPLAAKAGMGWQGKHTNLVSRDFGSWLFLGVILTTLDIPEDEAEEDHCGSCSRCLDICPTQAFPAAYQLDARRCISYLTIEHKGPIPHSFREALGNRIYGCDDCLAVCPWNKYASTARETAFHPRDELSAPMLVSLAQLDDAAFRTLFSKSPVKRIGRDRFLRNVAIALGNTGAENDAQINATVRKLVMDKSPLVRGGAIWAAQRLLPHHDFIDLYWQQAGSETDDTVADEWRQAFNATEAR